MFYWVVCMPTYISLINFTQDGIESIDEIAQRDADGKAVLESAGVELIDHYYTLGQYDEVAIFEGPDESVVKAALEIASDGNISTETLRAFSESEFHDIVAELAD